MEASGGGQEETTEDEAAPELQLDQAEPVVDRDIRMPAVDDEELHPAYDEPGGDQYDDLADAVDALEPEGTPAVEERVPLSAEILASVRRPEPTAPMPVGESPESRRSESRQSDEVRLQMGQLTEMLQTLVQGQQTLTSRLERVEEARSSHSWRSAESSQGLGWVDQGALDRWYAEATARAVASGHRDADMYIAGDVQGFSNPPEAANPWLRTPSWWTSRAEPSINGLGGCGGPLPPPGFGGQQSPWTFPPLPPPPSAFPFSSHPQFLGQAQALHERALQQRSEAQASQDRSAQQRSEAQASQDRSAQQRSEAQAPQDHPAQQRLEAQALHDRPLQQRSEAQALHDRSLQQRSEAQALQDRSLQQRPEAQALQDRSLQQRLEAQVLPDRPLQQRPGAQALHDRPLQ